MLNKKGQGSTRKIVSFVLLLLFALLFIFKLPLTTSFLGLTAVIVFVVAFVKTDIALVIIILSMLLSPEISAGAAAGRSVIVRVEDLFLFVVFLGWLAKMAVKKELGLLRVTPLNQPIIAYTLICIVSSLIAILDGHLLPKNSIFFILKYVEYFLLFFMVVNNLKSVSQAKLYIFFFLLTMFIVCLYSWNTNVYGRLTAPFEEGGGEPNTFAGYLILMIAVIIGQTLFTSSRKLLFVYLGLIVIGFITFVLTLSRGGWLSFTPMFFTFVLLHRKSRPLFLLIALLAVMSLPFIMPTIVKKRIEATFYAERMYKFMGKKISLSESASDRIETWGRGFRTWVKSPVWGRGVPSGTVIDVQYIRILIETGVLGLLFTAWIIITLFSIGLRVYKDLSYDGFTRGLSLGFIAGLVGLLFHSFSAASFILIRIMEPFWFIAGLIVVLPELHAQEKLEIPHES